MKQSWFLFFLCSFLYPNFIFSQPQNIHLSWNSSEEDATAKTMAVTWSEDKSGKEYVQYGIDKKLRDKEKASSQFSDSAKVYIFKTTLLHLNPNTTYYYKCGSDKTGWSDTYSFKTAPEFGSQQKFIVGVWADTQDNSFNTHFEQTDTIVKQLLKYPFQFTIHMGDIVDNGRVAAKWNGFFSTTQPVNSFAPLMAVTGNHDVNNNVKDPNFQKPWPIFYEYLNLPGNNTDYSFNYGNTHFVAISSGDAKDAEPIGNFKYAPDSPEYKWLESDLSKARNDKRIMWIILYFHHPLYSFGWSNVLGWQKHITPLIDKYKVDLCLSGHRHEYERHKAIRDEQVLPQNDNHLYEKPQGTVYITNGTAGGSPQGLGGEKMPSMIYTNPVKMYNYAIMTIDGNTISYDVYSNHGEKIDYFKLTK